MMDNLTTQLCITSAIREIEKHCKTSPNIQEREKYAELGRLALEVLKKLEFSDSGCCFFCYETKHDGHNHACQLNSLLKRAELLGEDKRNESNYSGHCFRQPKTLQRLPLF